MTLTPEQSQKSADALLENIKSRGYWTHVCVHCNRIIGVKLADCGEPTKDDLRKCRCPHCHICKTVNDDGEYDGNQHIRLEFVHGTGTQETP